MSEDQVLGAMLYDLNFGHKVRLVLNSLGVSRALLWLTVLRDGSVVLGLSRAASDVLRSEQESGGQREVRVNFADAEPVTDPHGKILGSRYTARCKIIVSNAGSPVLVHPPDQGLSLVFDVAGVERPGGLRLQLILANQALGQWPQRTLFAWSGRQRTST